MHGERSSRSWSIWLEICWPRREASDDCDDAAVVAATDLLAQVVDQDVVVGDDGEAVIRKGVAPDRVISHSDPEMRHGRSRRRDVSTVTRWT
jgi:hypothetical protein